MDRLDNEKKVELLAPAGSFECLVTAINAGCDAVYVGGTDFGARAFANNFDKDNMIKAIEYAHLYGKKLYITVNTLLKDNEIEKLYDYIYPYYIAGCDAVIVQDVGVMKYIHEKFKDLPIHASTQMTLMTAESANMLKSYGVERIVTPRELSLDEIRKISFNTELEIETFVHGALCYCYSGQCLMSSMIGTRSGNRGRCAQPCRKEYKINDTKKGYFLSTKDMCALELIPEMIKSGVDSFKIEGRMKKPEYVAAVVSIYRKYIDYYMDKKYDEKTKEEIEQDKIALMDIYNRGGFDKGYFLKHNGKEMMSMNRPNHYGVHVGKVVKVEKNKCSIELNKKINGKDLLEIRANSDDKNEDSYEFTLKDMDYNEKNITTRFNKELNIKKGQLVYRIRNQKLIEKLTDSYINYNKKIEVTGYFTAKKGKSMEFKLVTHTSKVSHTSYGDIVEAATNRPVTKERIEKQIAKFGDTKFELVKLNMDIDEDIFVPMGKINELRRNAVSDLEKSIISKYYRKIDEEIYDKNITNQKCIQKNIEYTVLINDKKTVNMIIQYEKIQCVYVETYNISSYDVNEIIEKLHNADKKVYLALPHILRYDNIKKFEDEYKDILLKCDGYLVRNMEGISISNRLCKKYILDYNMYTFNNYAKNVWESFGAYKYTLSLEASKNEIENIFDDNAEMVVYGYTPVMISAQCVNKNTNKCTKHPENLYLKDVYGESFLIRNICKYCYNIIYNSQPVLLKENVKCKRLRIEFTKEDENQIKDILNCILKDDNRKNILGSKGHYRREVD